MRVLEGGRGAGFLRVVGVVDDGADDSIGALKLEHTWGPGTPQHYPCPLGQAPPQQQQHPRPLSQALP